MGGLNLNNQLEKLASNKRQSILFLCFISLFSLIGLGGFPLFDWDEINFAESAREMMESGDYLRVQINYAPFWEKPPLFFWLQVASMKLFGMNEFAARFPNAVLGAVYLVTFYLIGRKHFSPRFGLLWALIFAASILPSVYFRSGIIDPLFNYFIFLSVYFMSLTLGLAKNKQRGKWAVLSGVFSALSVITKGPVGFLLLGLTLFVSLILRRFKNFPKPKFILLFLAGFSLIVTGWLALEVSNNGFSILEKFIKYQVELFNSPVAGHEQPFYYHFVVVLLGCFPSSILAFPFLLRKQESSNDLLHWNQLLFWSVLLLFSIVTTKIIHYSSMTYVPLAFIAAYTLEHYAQGYQIRKVNRLLFLTLGIIVAIAISAFLLLIYKKELLYPLMNDSFALESLKHAEAWSGLEFLIGLILLTGVIVSFFQLKSRKILPMVFSLCFSSVITLTLLMVLIMPKIERITQGPCIDFLKSHANDNAYIEAYGFKSYAPYFYGKTPPGNRKESRDNNWLLQGEIDKDVFMISKVNNTSLDQHPYFKRIDKIGGFVFYKRTFNSDTEAQGQ